MNPWYLLPCPCGESVRIMPRHAGESRTCECGQSLTVPNMREIRHLEAATDETTEVVQPTKRWSPLKGLLFVTGIPIFLIATGIGSYCFWTSSKIKSPYTTRPEVEVVLNRMGAPDIDNLTLTETIEDVWKPILELPELPNYAKPSHVFWRGIRETYDQRGKWALWAAVFGLLLTVAALVIPAKK